MVRSHITVKGRVQGVGYRYFCQTCADAKELTGWVKNVSDESVEIEIQGTKENIESFTKELSMGPSMAQVTEVIANDIETNPDEESFIISF